METLFRLLPGPQPALVRYGATALIVLAAYGLRLSVGEGTGRFGFIHFVLPVVISSLIFSRGTGYFAVALSAVLVSSAISWGAADIHANISAIAVFAVVGVSLVILAEGLHDALFAAHAAQRATELLLQEMSHRVKNKFSMISSIIALQARSSSPDVRHALEDVASRVNIIATVHEYLQLSRHDGLIEMSEYLPGLSQALRDALCGPRPISVHVQAVSAQLPAESALAVGVIVNELVTNAFKYAFPTDAPGRIDVQFANADGDHLLSVKDTGQGYPDACASGLGTRLVTVFAAKLGGTAEWRTADEGGCSAVVRFPRNR